MDLADNQTKDKAAWKNEEIKYKMATLTTQQWRLPPDGNGTSTIDKLPAIPVIRNVITNEELSNKIEGFKVPPSANDGAFLVKTLKLLSDKHSKHLAERHGRAINKLLRAYRHGVHLKDFKVLLGIIIKCHDNIKLDIQYENFLCSLTPLFSLPFLKSKVSDEQTYMKEVCNCLSQLGLIAEEASDNVKIAISASLAQLYQSKGNGYQFSDCKPVSKKFIRKIIEESEICKSIAECTSQVSDSETRYMMLRSLNTLANTIINCSKMLQADVATSICNNLARDIKSYKLLFIGIETLWNILDHGDHEIVANQLAKESCLISLQNVFLHQMNQFSSCADRHLRNDIVIIISLIASKYPLAPFVECGLTKTLSMFSIHPEIPTNNPMINKIKLTPAPEDFELKKLFFNLIALLCQSHLSVNVMAANHVMLLLFSYIVPIKDACNSFWTLAEFEELQLQSLVVLSMFSPARIRDYMSCQGNARLLAMLDWCVSSNEFFGHGNSFYGFGGQGNKRAQMKLSIRVLRNMCATGDADVCQDLTDQGLIQQLVAILLSCSTSVESNDSIDIEIQCDMLFILASLSEETMHRKSLFGDQGVKMILQYMEALINAKQDSSGNHKLVLATLDCLSATVVGCYINEIDFLKREGAFMLLDLLDMSPDNMKSIILVSIADLLENNKTVPHLMMWRGESEKTVAKTLVDIWFKEEKMLGVARESRGVITDITKPLLTAYQAEEEIEGVPSNYQTPSIIDVSDNMRSKVYGIFCKIGFNNIPGLMCEDYVTLSVIERYLDFKTLEIWHEIKRELEIERIEPIPFDKECLNEILMILQNKALAVTVIQKALIESNFEQAVVDERNFYEKIKETYKQKEKSYEDFCNFIDRTSDYTILKETKKAQLKLIDISRQLSKKSKDENTLNHETMEQSLQSTTFCGRHLIVESTKFNGQADDEKTLIEKNLLSELLIN